MNSEIQQRINQIESGIVPEGYQQTKVGIIPNDWKVNKLAEVFYEIRDKLGNSNFETYSISGKMGFISQTERFGKDISGAQNENYIVLNPNQFSYNKGNSKTYKYGCVYLNLLNKTIAVPNVFISFGLRSKNMDNLFFAKLFENHYLDKYLRKIISSSARMDGLLNINKKYFFDIPIMIPSDDEQNSISNIIFTIDNQIDLKKKLIKNEKKLKKGLMQNLFSGEKRFEEFTKDLQTIQLGKILEEYNKTKRFSSEGLLSGKYPFFNNSIKDFNKYLNDFDFDGELIIANTGGVAYFDYYNGKCATMADCFVFTSKNSVKFIYFYLKLNQSKINELGFLGSGMKHLDKPYFRKLKINLPSIQEQEKIAEVLQTQDNKINLLEKELEQLKQQKKSLMQLLLTGIVRVKY
jgi:type I restriction enzyme S subunit